MEKCNLCSEASDFNYCLRGKNSDKTGLMIVLHRADRRINEYLEGYWGALTNSATGIILDKMLIMAGLEFQDVYMTNFFKCLLPKDRSPSWIEYDNCKKILDGQIQEFSPNCMVIFGNSTYKHLFPKESKKARITDQDKVLEYNGIPALISLHPSQIWKKLNPGLQKEYINRVSEFLTKYKR
jgi:uracil-DNA glycosylase family 4